MIIIGADHAGFDLKDLIIEYFKESNIEYQDVTDYDRNDKDDYTDVAIDVCKGVLNDKNNLGIAICGTGLGICIACNKVKGIIATPCFDVYTATMARKHNDSNILCLGGRLEYSKSRKVIIDIIRAYLETKFDGERHLIRVNKIKQMEDKFGEKLCK
ncbi:MAG: sugar-phosphate isomerase, RpiB/LacA/LacB family [Clostridia bacterium]|jgi:ribose 5-phosphate isomerase B|nr:sugar-phosphate isomerase, RpiB/LacA/LacB family [Clostridia bacterium]